MQPSVSIHNCSLLSGYRAVNRKVFTVIVRDVSLRKQSEDALRRSEERFSKAFRNNSLAITISILIKPSCALSMIERLRFSLCRRLSSICLGTDEKT